YAGSPQPHRPPPAPVYPAYPQHPPPGYPPPYASVDSRTQELEFELARAREREAASNATLEEARRAQREGRQPNLDPAGTSSTSEERIVVTLVETLVKLGVITPGGRTTGAGATP